MTKRRSRGDGGIRWSESRQRWIAELTVGWRPNGKRIVRTASGRTKTEAKEALDEMRRDLKDGTPAGDRNYTVRQAVEDWLQFGLPRRGKTTVDKLASLARTHVIPCLGARRLRDLTADEVDAWLVDRARFLATRSLQDVRSILQRAVARAQAREKVRRNVVLLCEVPDGQRAGRPSSALTLAQAEAVLAAAGRTQLRAYIVVALLVGARTEELRPLTWSHVDLIGRPDANPPVPPHIMVWRSVRASGDTKTRKSRRSLALPARCVAALIAQRTRIEVARRIAGERWHANDLVFPSDVGTELDAANVRRGFRQVIKAAELDPKQWTPRELRHSFTSLLSDHGIPVEVIGRLLGHRGTAVTELVYRHQIRPVIEHGAVAMDEIFGPLDP